MPNNPNPVSPPSLAEFRGELIFADLAYRSFELKRGLSRADFEKLLSTRVDGRIQVPTRDGSLPYSAQSLASQFSVVLSTSDREVTALLGKGLSGGTSSGLQAVIFRHNQTGQYFISVAGVTDDELLPTYFSVQTYGFRYEWSKHYGQNITVTRAYLPI